MVLSTTSDRGIFSELNRLFALSTVGKLYLYGAIAAAFAADPPGPRGGRTVAPGAGGPKTHLC